MLICDYFIFSVQICDIVYFLVINIFQVNFFKFCILCLLVFCILYLCLCLFGIIIQIKSMIMFIVIQIKLLKSRSRLLVVVIPFYLIWKNLITKSKVKTNNKNNNQIIQINPNMIVKYL